MRVFAKQFVADHDEQHKIVATLWRIYRPRLALGEVAAGENKDFTSPAKANFSHSAVLISAAALHLQ